MPTPPKPPSLMTPADFAKLHSMKDKPSAFGSAGPKPCPVCGVLGHVHP